MRKKRNNTPEEDELLKTQVLNLSDVEQIAKFEKKTSKKPAIILAITGLFSITVGLTYPFITSGTSENHLQAKESINEELNNNDELTTTVTNSSIANKIQEETLNCSYTQLGNDNGTDATTTLNFIFSEEKLQSYTKILDINPTVGNTIGETSIQNLLVGYQYFETIPLTGYTISTIKTETGIRSTVNIDLTTLDKTTLTSAHIANGFTNVEYELNTDKNAINTELTSAGYTCQ